MKEFQRRCAAAGIRTAADRRRVRDQLLHEAGGITYDHIVTEFGKVARGLDWPRPPRSRISGTCSPPAWKTPGCRSTTGSSCWASRPAGPPS